MTIEQDLISLDALVELRTEKAGGRKDRRRRYVGLEHMAQASPMLLGTAPGDFSSSVNCVFEADDILFGKLRPNLRKSLLAPFAGYCSTDILVLRAREGVVPSFAAHVFQWERVFSAAVRTAAGTKMPRTSWSDLRRTTVVCKQPSDVQARIAQILDLTDTSIEKTAAVVKKLEQVREGLRHDLVANGLDPSATKPLVRSADIRFSSVDKKSNSGEKPVRLCNYTDVYNNTYITARMPFMAATATQSEIARFGLCVGDVIITKDSETPDDIGVPAVVDEAAADLVCGYHLALIRPKLDEVDPLFLAMQLGHDRLRRYFGQQANGTTRYGLSIRAIEQAPIIDIPVEEQTRRSNVLREHDRAARAMETELTKLRMIKEGLMEDLLSGRVPVPVPSESGVLEAVQ